MSWAAFRWQIWLWGPVVGVLIVITLASAQPKHAPPPGPEPDVYLSGLMPVFADTWDLVIKKSAHMLAYGLLALLNLRALHHTGYTPRTAAYLGILLAVSFGLLDELHQSFVTGRNSSVLDVGFDYVGATLAGLTARRLMERRTGCATASGSMSCAGDA
jgi:VanZ family protein